MHRRTVLHIAASLALVTLLGPAGCGSGTAARRDTSILTVEEIGTITVSNLYEAVNRLRPRWLEIRGVRSVNSGTIIAVYMNRSYMGDIEVLKTFDAKAFQRLRWLDSSTASATLSGHPTSSHLEGAIVLETRSGGI